MDPEATESIERFLTANLILVILSFAVLVAVYVSAQRIIHTIVGQAMAASSGRVEEGGVAAIELAKRTRTLETLLTKLVRTAVVGVMAFLLVGYFGLWGVVAAFALVIAGLTIAGQSIVLDYMMGILIVIEGTYFEGDTISVGDPSWSIEGTVEDVGLRRTIVRAADGTVHSISNADLRRVSNSTRLYAAAEVQVRGIPDEELDHVVAVMDRVGQEVADDPAYKAFIMEAPTVGFLGDPDDLGWSATMRGKVLAGQRWAVSTEVRRRLNRAFLDEGINLNKRGLPAPPDPVASQADPRR